VAFLKLGNISLVETDLNYKIPLGDNDIDIVLGAAILEHLADPNSFIKECRRILKPGGRLVLTTPAPPLADAFLKILVKLRLIKADEVSDHIYYFSLNGLKKITEEAGLEAVKVNHFLWGLNNLIVAEKR
jgi:ubiquinone/menaquinone biosynthesis C-methylase UbiE